MKISKNLFPYFKQQIQVLGFLQKHVFSKIPKEFKKYYAFGGGTALSLCYFQHRLSFDVDIFIYDVQLMNYINPQIFFEDIEDEIDDYMCMSHQINMITKDEIYINILSVENLNPNKNTFLELKNDSILVETPEEIIAKKIIHRKNDNKVRDLFDIAFALHLDRNFLNELLKLKYINKNDLAKFYQAIQKVDEKEIEKELKIISPFKKINNIISIIRNAIDSCNLS
jgi:predicted nucleotidyltransferase component of viral defense system